MESQKPQSSAAVEFTYNWYQEFLDQVEDAGYEFRRFSDDLGRGDVVLRHDVDLSLKDALQLALLEADRDVSATYCVLLTSALYNPLEREQREQIHEIASLGHEVALHFSTHEYWDTDERPNDETLTRHVEAEREILESLVPEITETVSFHSPPEWVLNRDFEGMRNTYAPTYLTEMAYVADSGQRWRDAPPDVEKFGPSAQVLTHPGLWNESDDSFEECVERAVTGACRHANAKAQREFIGGDD